MQIGDRVRHSGYALQSERDYWQACGSEPRKSQLRDAYMARVAERGTITAVGLANGGIEVQWDHGPVSRCLTSRVEVVR